MNYLVVGVNHKTAPLAIREKLSFDAKQSQEFLSEILATRVLKESAVLSTCNRTEIYGVADGLEDAKSLIKSHLAGFLGKGIDPYSYEKQDSQAIEHLFEVTSSLDSMVVGENQISGQVKASFEQAKAQQGTGPYLNQLFHRAFYVAKRVKTETKIGQGQVSLGSVSVMLAKKIFGRDQAYNMTLFGAGEIGKTVLQCLREENAEQNVVLINRTFAKAKALEEEGLGKAIPLENLQDALLTTDVFISSVAKDYQGFSKEQFAELMRARKNKPLFLIDLGMPRNLPQSLGDLENVYLYNLDDLQGIAEKNQKFRKEQVSEAKNIIDEEAKAFYNAISDRLSQPMIAGLNKKFEGIRKEELQKSLGRLEHLSTADKTAIDNLTKAITRKILHDPIFQIKRAQDSEKSLVFQVVEKIFRLKDEEET